MVVDFEAAVSAAVPASADSGVVVSEAVEQVGVFELSPDEEAG